MRFAPSLFWLGAGVWVGGLFALAIVAAPTIFRTAPSRESAGLIFGAVLRAFSKVEFACALLIAAGIFLTWPRPPATRDFLRAALLAAMVAAWILVQAWIFPAMETLRPELAASESVRGRFQKLHKISEGLYAFNLCAGLALIVLSAWGPRRAG